MNKHFNRTECYRKRYMTNESLISHFVKQSKYDNIHDSITQGDKDREIERERERE